MSNSKGLKTNKKSAHSPQDTVLMYSELCLSVLKGHDQAVHSQQKQRSLLRSHPDVCLGNIFYTKCQHVVVLNSQDFLDEHA